MTRTSRYSDPSPKAARGARTPEAGRALDVEAVCRRLVEEFAKERIESLEDFTKAQEERIEVLETEVGRLTELREQDADEIGRLREEVRFLTYGPWGKGFAVDDFMSQAEGEDAAPALGGGAGGGGAVPDDQVPLVPHDDDDKDPPPGRARGGLLPRKGGVAGGLGQPGIRAKLRESLFPDSIYSRLLLDDVDLGKFGSRKLLLRDKFWAVWTLVVQLGSYAFLAYLMINKVIALGNEFSYPSLEIDGDRCHDESLADAGIAAEDFLGLIHCGNPKESIGINFDENFGLSFVVAFIALMLLIHFIVPDVVGACIALFADRRSKAVAVIVLAEATVAMFVGGMALSAINYVGGLDAFLYCVGIAFIHDIDEIVAIADRSRLALYQLRGRQPYEKRLYLFMFAFVLCGFGAVYAGRLIILSLESGV